MNARPSRRARAPPAAAAEHTLALRRFFGSQKLGVFFGGGGADPFLDSDAGKVAKLDFANTPQSNVIRFEQWLQTPVDQNGNELGGFDEPGAMTRKLLYKLEDQADKQGTTVGSDLAMGEATIDVEGVLELTPAMISDIQNRLASGDAQAISEAKQDLIDAGIPYADRFPELNDY